MEIKRILITKQGKSFFVRDLTKDFHTQFGYIKAKDLKKKSGSVRTNTKKELNIIEASFIDSFKRIKRGPQIIQLKDAATIIAETGVNQESKVVDAGAGSGALACFLAHYVKSITTYEIRKDFFDIVKKNSKFLGLENIKVKNKDIYKGISEKNLDLITLDLSEPWKAIEHASKSLKNGGFLVSYSPTIPQVMDFVKTIYKNKSFTYIKTIELLEREWEVNDRKVRPKSRMTGHTGFLSFARKV